MDEAKSIFELADRGAYGGADSASTAGSATVNADGSVTVPSVCAGCHSTCQMYVDVAEGRVLRTHGVPGAFKTDGVLCAKGLAGAQIAHDPRRVLHPLRRAGERHSGRFERISWDEAISELAGRVRAAIDARGPWSVSFIRGQACGWGFTYDMTQRLAHCVGTEVGVGASECFVPRAITEGMTYGGMPSFGDIIHADLIIYWGKQPSFSTAPMLAKILDARDRGAKLVVVDPLRFHLAAVADQVIQVEPGTDLALVLAMLYVIVDEGLWDAEFADRWTNDPGLARLSAHLAGANKLGQAYTPEWAAPICGVPADVITAFAREYATTPCASIATGHGLEGRVNVVQTTRALCILRAITGHLDREGCDLFTPKAPSRAANFTLIDHVLPDFEPTGPSGLFHVPPYNPDESRYPLLFGGQGLLSTPDVLRMMHEGKIEVCIVQGANPVVTQPQPAVTTAAFKKIGYLCVIDPYLSETARLADLVLPAATYLERTEPEWFNCTFPEVTLRQKAVTVGEALPDTQIMIELGRALGFTEEFPTHDISWYIDQDLAPSGITYAQLRESPHGVRFGGLGARGYEKGGFRSPGGVVNVWSEVLDGAGFDPLPNWEDSSESPRSAPEVAAEFPYVVFTGRSGPMYVHEQRRTIPWLRELQPEGRAMVNTRRAAELGLADGDWARISSPRGSIEMRVEVTPILREDWIYVPGGWADANYNELGIDDALDPISSQANYTACLGRIEKIDGPSAGRVPVVGMSGEAGAASGCAGTGRERGGLLARLLGRHDGAGSAQAQAGEAGLISCSGAVMVPSEGKEA